MTSRVQIGTRTQGRYGQMGYHTVRSANRDGLIYTQASGDTHLIRDRAKLVVQSRDFYRNNAIYKGLIDRAVSYTVGTGFGLQVLKGNRQVEKLWKDFFKRPEVRGLLSGSEVSQMVCREAMLAGDNGQIKTDEGDGLIQLVESEQIIGKTGRYDDGVLKNDYGKPTGYNVSEYNAQGQVSRRTAKTISPEDFMFITCPDRPSSTRGVPACQASFPMLHRINDVCDSEAIAYQMLSRLALSVTRASGAFGAHAESATDAGASDDSITDRLVEMDYAIMFHGEVGEEVKGIERNIPGKNFSESIRMFMRLLGLPLGLPLELVLLDWTQSNYSQSRAVMEQAYQTFTVWQDKLDSFFYRPFLEWKLEQWKSEGLIKSTKLEYAWIKPTFPWIDQLKEAKAYGEKVDRGFASHTAVCKALNSDRDTVCDMLQFETIDAIKRAQAVEKATGQKVDWRPFAGKMEVPAAVELDMQDDDNPTTPSKKDNDNED